VGVVLIVVVAAQQFAQGDCLPQRILKVVLPAVLVYNEGGFAYPAAP
jgi:hypothetical protein